MPLSGHSVLWLSGLIPTPGSTTRFISIEILTPLGRGFHVRFHVSDVLLDWLHSVPECLLKRIKVKRRVDPQTVQACRDPHFWMNKGCTRKIIL